MKTQPLIQKVEPFKDHDYFHLFTQIDTKAHFDYQTYTIHITDANKSAAEAASNYISGKFTGKIKNSDYFLIESALSLITHEYTHFLDFSSSLFGFEHLKKLAAAAASQRSRHTDETEFYPAKQYADYLRTLRPSKYYDEKHNLNISRELWGAIPSSGVIFNSSGRPSTRPIIFVRFMTPDFIQIARAPISAVAVLEASAIAQELLASIDLIERSEDTEIKYAEITNKNIEFLYDARLTDYSVCAHLVANHLGCKDFLLVARIIATLTRIILNTSPSSFDDIHRNIESTPYFLGMPKTEDTTRIKKRIRTALKFRDMGALFFLMAQCMPKMPKPPSEFQSFISQTLAQSGFKKDWIEKSKDHASQLIRTVESFDIPHLTKFALCGLKNYTTLLNSGHQIDFNKMHLPSCYIARDTEVISISDFQQNELADIDLLDIWELGTETEVWVGKVESACLNF